MICGAKEALDGYPQPKSNPDVTTPYVMYPGTPLCASDHAGDISQTSLVAEESATFPANPRTLYGAPSPATAIRSGGAFGHDPLKAHVAGTLEQVYSRAVVVIAELDCAARVLVDQPLKLQLRLPQASMMR